MPPAGLPEIAFAGRSNVGKSSLINRLLRRKKFARVSNTPGRTREINFFEVNGAFILADLPGYGYARVSKERKAAWRPLIEGYLRGSPTLRGVVHLLDARDASQTIGRRGEAWTRTGGHYRHGIDAVTSTAFPLVFVFGLQCAPQHLARDRLGQGVAKFDVRGHFERRELRAAVGS